jgi:hypothetical protein
VGDDRDNPNGVATALYASRDEPISSRLVRWVGERWRLGHNPFGVGELVAVAPGVAEYGNPGLEDGSPSGKMSKLQVELLTEFRARSSQRRLPSRHEGRIMRVL